LKYSREKQRQKTEKEQMNLSQSQMQHESDLAMQKAKNDAALIQMKEDNANFRAEIQAISKNLQVLLQRIEGGVDGISPLTMEMQQMASPEAQMQMQMQQQQQGMMPPMEEPPMEEQQEEPM